MKICAYVQSQYAKANYKNECMDTRQFVGLRVIIDCLERNGYSVDYAGSATVHHYDIVLVSITSDCDWWPFIRERQMWEKGNYKVLVGGAGVLHITPFTKWFYAAMFGRGENLIVPLVKSIENGERYENESIAYSDSFDPNKIYRVAQIEKVYPFKIKLSEKRFFTEGAIGCNHKCLFCGYTWQRKFISEHDFYAMSDSLFGGIKDKERALLDMAKNFNQVDFSHLRTTAMDGMSERIRRLVGKPITRKTLLDFFAAMLKSSAKPHQIKLYNIIGFPTETYEDWEEFLDVLRDTDQISHEASSQWSIVLHSTPFRAMPATPLACAPMSKNNYRGKLGNYLGRDLKGNLIFQGKNVWCVESMGTDSLSSVMLSAIAHRGEERDIENITRLCSTPKFWSAPSTIKEATLEKYFDMDKMFGAYTADNLPSRYLRTYCKVEQAWEHPFW